MAVAIPWWPVVCDIQPLSYADSLRWDLIMVQTSFHLSSLLGHLFPNTCPLTNLQRIWWPLRDHPFPLAFGNAESPATLPIRRKFWWTHPTISNVPGLPEDQATSLVWKWTVSWVIHDAFHISSNGIYILGNSKMKMEFTKDGNAAF